MGVIGDVLRRARGPPVGATISISLMFNVAVFEELFKIESRISNRDLSLSAGASADDKTADEKPSVPQSVLTNRGDAPHARTRAVPPRRLGVRGEGSWSARPNHRRRACSIAFARRSARAIPAENRGRLCRVDPSVHHLSRQAPPCHYGSAGDHPLPVLARRGRERRRLHPEPGVERAAVPL